MPTQRKANNYIDNKSFTKLVAEHAKACRTATKTNQPFPEMPEDLAVQIMKIATRLSMKPNFNGYVHKEDMVGSAILACCKYLHNFNPAKSSNGFAYVTQICHNAFVRSIVDEKESMFRQMYLAETLAGTKPAKEYQTETNREHAGYQAWLTRHEQKKADRKATRETSSREPPQKAKKRAVANRKAAGSGKGRVNTSDGFTSHFQIERHNETTPIDMTTWKSRVTDGLNAFTVIQIAMKAGFSNPTVRRDIVAGRLEVLPTSESPLIAATPEAIYNWLVKRNTDMNGLPTEAQSWLEELRPKSEAA